MTKITQTIMLCACLLLISVSELHAQEIWSIERRSESLLDPNILAVYEVDLEQAVFTNLIEGDQISLPLPDGTMSVVQIETVRATVNGREIAGFFVGQQNNSLFYLQNNSGVLQGNFYKESSDVGYRFDYQGNNTLYSMNIDQIACIGFGEATGSNKMQGSRKAASIIKSLKLGSSPNVLSPSVPSHESLPGSDYVLYIDFDGEVEQGYWSDTKNNGNPIQAAPFSIDADGTTFNSQESEFIRLVWLGVSEDFSIFDVNVTTDRAVFDAADEHKRAKNVVTPSCHWYTPSCGPHGVAAYPQFGALKNFEDDTRGYSSSFVWPFNQNGYLIHNPQYVASGVSHEFGHAFWLVHDSQEFDNGSIMEYYDGNNEWVPIMGAQPNHHVISTWSRGEYEDAINVNLANPQDDILQITQFLTFRYDENEASYAQESQQGIIGSFDEDSYIIYGQRGKIINLSASVVAEQQNNLDLKMALYDPSGVLVQEMSTGDNDSVAFSLVVVNSGEYEVVLSGAASETLNSYTRYGSIGQYSFTVDTQWDPSFDRRFLLYPIINFILHDDDSVEPEL